MPVKKKKVQNDPGYGWCLSGQAADANEVCAIDCFILEEGI